jgi:hypothetical protein
VPVKKDSVKTSRQPHFQFFYLEKGKYTVVGTNSIKNAKISETQAQTDLFAYSSLMAPLSAQY